MSKGKPIGVFDSGVGGLTVLKKLVKVLPNEHYIYFGDTARVPYGDKTPEQLINIARDILNWYKLQNVKAVLMACNTSSAVALNIVKEEYNFPIFGIIQPTAKYVANLNVKRIGIIATAATAKSRAYSKAILELNKDKEVFETGCPGLVEIVESGKLDSLEAKNLVSKYITPLLENNFEKLILGCTHYPFLTKIINEITNNPDMLIDPAIHLTETIKSKLESLNLLNDSNKGIREYFVSGNPAKFVKIAENFYSDCVQAKKATFFYNTIL